MGAQGKRRKGRRHRAARPKAQGLKLKENTTVHRYNDTEKLKMKHRLESLEAKRLKR